MKRNHIVLSLILLAVLLILPLQVHADGAKATIETQIGKMLEKMKEPAFKELSKDAKLAEIRNIINDNFCWFTRWKRRSSIDHRQLNSK